MCCSAATTHGVCSADSTTRQCQNWPPQQQEHHTSHVAFRRKLQRWHASHLLVCGLPSPLLLYHEQLRMSTAHAGACLAAVNPTHQRQACACCPACTPCCMAYLTGCRSLWAGRPGWRGAGRQSDACPGCLQLQWAPAGTTTTSAHNTSYMGYVITLLGGLPCSGAAASALCLRSLNVKHSA